MKGLFISYRRSDAAATSGRLRDRFAVELGAARVFHDVASIEAGADFVAAIGAALARCDAMIVLIGRDWAGEAGRRLHDEADHVRAEIAEAMAKGLRIIPVLIDGAAMPGEADLPPELAAFARRNAFDLRNARFADDTDRLIEMVTGGAPRRGATPLRRLLALLAGAALGLVVYVTIGAAHRAATGYGLDLTIGRGPTLLLFPAFAAAGAFVAHWRFLKGR